ncbi:hypothetical protein BDN72DRAFT_834182 [Pluteus cervinus]|uniref:Uncharacterized protein n=1 Tax=Pluteus cervinus TaxID=181527 RepID=A0ACD3B6Y0_9AGAR|nr:hypothetical protein BDN72DRAFT_834182 [Pluteus cervinus]
MRSLSLIVVTLVALPVCLASLIDPARLLAELVANPALFSILFPLANTIGYFLHPILRDIIGHTGIEAIDDLADTLCIATPHDSSGGGGICQTFLEALYNFTQATIPGAQAEEFRNLIALLCIVPRADPSHGPCQALLGTVDCVANRIARTDDLECEDANGKPGHGKG